MKLVVYGLVLSVLLLERVYEKKHEYFQNCKYPI